MSPKHLIALLIFMTALSAHSQITLGSRRAVHDNLTGNWLCSVPESTFGTDFTATFNTSEPWSDITIDDEPVAPGDSFTFAQVTGDKKYALVAHIGDSVTITGNICFTFLPIFEFNGTFNDEYQVSEIIANLPQDQGPTTMLSKLKHRGGSTNGPTRLKRNYHIKFLDADSQKMDRKFFGLRNDNSWILDAGQIDMLRIRNRVCTELWLDMCRKPYYSDEEPKALLGVRGDFIELFLNGSYNGFYALTEAMDRKQMKLAKVDTDTAGVNTFHGMLWKAKVLDGITRMTSAYGYNNNSATWGGLEVKYPDPDDVMPTKWKTMFDATKFVAKSDNTTFRQQVGDYFDIPIIMDYWIFINAIHGVDSGVKNIYWGVYDEQVDNKITLAAWDLDCTFGQNWINSPLHNEAVVGPRIPLSTINNLFLRLHELSPDSFSIKTVERYQLLRQTLLSEESLKQRFHARLEPLRLAGALDRETVRWTRSTDLSRQPLDFPAELEYIDSWIDQHMTYLDNARFRPYIKGDSNRDGVVDVSDLNQIVVEILNGVPPTWFEDMNNDDVLDVSDLNAIVNVILGKVAR